MTDAELNAMLKEGLEAAMQKIEMQEADIIGLENRATVLRAKIVAQTLQIQRLTDLHIKDLPVLIMKSAK